MKNTFEFVDHMAVIVLGLLHLVAISFLSNRIGNDFYKIIFYSDFVSDEVLTNVVNSTAVALAISAAGWTMLIGEKIWKHISLKNRS